MGITDLEETVTGPTQQQRIFEILQQVLSDPLHAEFVQPLEKQLASQT